MAKSPIAVSVGDVRVNIGAPQLVIDMSTCGQSKGCFRHPSGCEPDHCEHIITWAPDKTDVKFEIDAKITKDDEGDFPWWWTSVGFSNDLKMVYYNAFVNVSKANI